MINLLQLQNEIMQNSEHIIEILEALNFDNIKEHSKYISFPNRDGDNPSGCVIYKDTLKYINWTRNINGNIFTLVMQEKKCNFSKALQWVIKTTGVKPKKMRDISYPFHGFYRKLLCDKEIDEAEEYIYKEEELPSPNAISKKFLDDGIPLITQEKWGVRYSHEDDAILIPIHNYVGELVGCKARNNDPNCTIDKRWWAYLEYRKTRYIYGWYENYQTIQKKEMAIIVEAEKSVMVLDGWNCHLGLAVGGHNISKTQTRYIKSLMAKKIIVAFDQGLSEEEIAAEARKLIPKHHFVDTKIGYIFDKDGKYLKDGSKDAPVDLGVDIFRKLMKECVIWL